MTTINGPAFHKVNRFEVFFEGGHRTTREITVVSFALETWLGVMCGHVRVAVFGTFRTKIEMFI